LKAFNEAAICKECREVRSLPFALDHLSDHMLLLPLWEWLPEDPGVWMTRDLVSETEIAGLGALEAVPDLKGP
jgi:hypothetical protein